MNFARRIAAGLECISERGERTPLKDRRDESRRWRRRFSSLRNPGRMSDNDGPNHFACGRHNRRSRHHKYGRRHCWPYRILAARHRARHHSAHIVPTIHGLLFLRRRLLTVMMLLNRAVGARAAIHSMRQQRRGCQRRVQQRDRQHAEACRANSRRFALNAICGHNHTSTQ